MAREASIEINASSPITFNASTSDTWEKGSVLKLTDNMTVALAAGDTDIVAGIAATEKLSGEANASVYVDGIFRVYVGAAGATVGAAAITDVATGDTNEFVNADVNSENIAGRFLETGADGTTVLMQLNPFTVNLA